ncbi:MAG: CDGSH iron-sulfur domain-containing protein [Leptospirales bacterium]
MKCQIRCQKDGPYELRGPVRIQDALENVTETESMAHHLCRCGASSIKPFCDGTHETVGFQSE